MADTIFTKIIKGEIPAYKIYEDENSLAFLSIHPVTRGHVLVIPKVQIASIWELPAKNYDALMATTRLVAQHIHAKIKTKFLCMRVVGEEIPHAHVHLIPFNTADQLGFEPEPDSEVDHQQLSELRDLLSFKA